MMNSGMFKKGEKRLGQGKRGPGKVTIQTREAISRFADSNAHRLQEWLDEIQSKDGAKSALEAYTKLLEYTVPKISRTVLASDGEPQEIIFRWEDSNV